MEEASARKLRFLALQVVGAVAVVHLVVGLDQLASVAAQGLLDEYLTTYLPAHPRAFLFLTSGVAAFAGIVAVARGRLSLRTGYLLGVGLLATYLVGWVAWHTVLDHGLALGAARPAETGHSHAGLVDTLVSHYVEPIAGVLAQSTTGQPGTGRVLLGVVAATLELVGIALLIVLLRVDPRIERPDSRFGFDPLEE